MARIYDPGRAEIYQRLGIPTVATVKWTSDQMLRRLLPQGHVPEFTDPSVKWSSPRCRCRTAGSAGGWATSRRPPVAGSPTSPGWATGMIPRPETVYQEGDLLHIALRREDLATAERVLTPPPPAH